jgi:trk system potassium uptake protein TrkH
LEKNKHTGFFGWNPWQQLIYSFLFLIGIGTVLLRMPAVTVSGESIGWVNALFESTSAVCVTGLAVVPTSAFNVYGQLVILFLIQLGALGIMTFSSYFLLQLKGKIGLKHRLSLREVQDSISGADTKSVLRSIFRITMVVEAVGFVLLTIGFMLQKMPPGEAVYNGFFHAVSAFCNAGFSTFDDSLMNAGVWVKIVTALLIIIGGLGYLVIYELLNRKPKKRFGLHTRMVLVSTAILIIGGMILFEILEHENLSLVDSFFQSVTARTAGFNTIDLTRLNLSSVFLLMLLMFIGASPGSTGGGVKTTTFYVIMSSVLTVVKGKSDVVVFHRRIPVPVILKAFAIVILYFGIISLGNIVLLYYNEHVHLLEGLFETVSAMGTVGLSMGITPDLNAAGKLILTFLMFTGRLGPLAFIMSVESHRKDLKIIYPEEEVYL